MIPEQHEVDSNQEAREEETLWSRLWPLLLQENPLQPWLQSGRLQTYATTLVLTILLVAGVSSAIFSFRSWGTTDLPQLEGAAPSGIETLSMGVQLQGESAFLINESWTLTTADAESIQYRISRPPEAEVGADPSLPLPPYKPFLRFFRVQGLKPPIEILSARYDMLDILGLPPPPDFHAENLPAALLPTTFGQLVIVGIPLGLLTDKPFAEVEKGSTPPLIPKRMVGRKIALALRAQAPFGDLWSAMQKGEGWDIHGDRFAAPKKLTFSLTLPSQFSASLQPGAYRIVIESCTEKKEGGEPTTTCTRAAPSIINSLSSDLREYVWQELPIRGAKRVTVRLLKDSKHV